MPKFKSKKMWRSLFLRKTTIIRLCEEEVGRDGVAINIHETLMQLNADKISTKSFGDTFARVIIMNFSLHIATAEPTDRGLHNRVRDLRADYSLSPATGQC